MAKKFVTTKGPGTLALSPFYIGIPQHDRTMSKKEAYAFFAERTGYKPAAVRAVFLALAAFAKENAGKGNTTHIDGVASWRARRERSRSRSTGRPRTPLRSRSGD